MMIDDPIWLAMCKRIRGNSYAQVSGFNRLPVRCNSFVAASARPPDTPHIAATIAIAVRICPRLHCLQVLPACRLFATGVHPLPMCMREHVGCGGLARGVEGAPRPRLHVLRGRHAGLHGNACTPGDTIECAATAWLREWLVIAVAACQQQHRTCISWPTGRWVGHAQEDAIVGVRGHVVDCVVDVVAVRCVAILVPDRQQHLQECVKAV